jgi:hypothetical protein
MKNQDAAFYTDGAGVQTIWYGDDNKARFSVIRNGEMRIHARQTLDEEPTVIRYTDQLEAFGVKTDADLQAWTDKGDEYFTWVNNAWFEVWDAENTDYYSDVIDTLDDAIEYAKQLEAKPALASWE